MSQHYARDPVPAGVLKPATLEFILPLPPQRPRSEPLLYLLGCSLLFHHMFITCIRRSDRSAAASSRQAPPGDVSRARTGRRGTDEVCGYRRRRPGAEEGQRRGHGHGAGTRTCLRGVSPRRKGELPLQDTPGKFRSMYPLT